MARDLANSDNNFAHTDFSVSFANNFLSDNRSDLVFVASNALMVSPSVLGFSFFIMIGPESHLESLFANSYRFAMILAAVKASVCRQRISGIICNRYSRGRPS